MRGPPTAGPASFFLSRRTDIVVAQSPGGRYSGIDYPTPYPAFLVPDGRETFCQERDERVARNSPHLPRHAGRPAEGLQTADPVGHGQPAPLPAAVRERP